MAASPPQPENPYRSPATGEPISDPPGEVVVEKTDGMPGCARFFFHMLITSLLAPGAGSAVVAFFFSHWSDANLFFRLGASAILGPVLVLLSWYLVIPFGVGAYFLCRALSNARVASLSLWMVGGAVIGMSSAWFMAVAVSFSGAGLIVVIGGVVGLISAWVLWLLWIAASPWYRT